MLPKPKYLTTKRIKYIPGIIVIWFFVVFAKSAQAVIPPDFIFNIGSQIAQFFSIILIFFSAIFGAMFQFFKTRFYTLPHRKVVLGVAVLLIVIVSLAASYFYATYRQKVEYQKWLAESNQYAQTQDKTIDSDVDGLTDAEELNLGTDPNNPDTDGDSFPDGQEVTNGYNPNGTNKIGAESANVDASDQLNIGPDNQTQVDTSSSTFVTSIDVTDPSAKFIADYYQSIAEGNIDRAYAMSKKSVSLATFKSWYLSTTKITLEKLVRIDANKSSIELTLYEGSNFIRYGVLMVLNLQNSSPISIEQSEVKILSEGSVSDQTVSVNDDTVTQEYGFFIDNEKKDIRITNQDFKNVADGQANNYLVLDARENIEYENGFFPGSSHIRFADLKAGRWLELPKDKFVYVLCWSGIRGQEVAEFLRTKKIVASYLENGANGWVEYGGKWTGSIKFGEQYNEARYQIVFNTAEIKNKVKDGVLLVDTREPYKYNQSHIAGSINIPIMYTPTVNIESVFGQVPAHSQVITVCDGYVNCFDAKITGVELERRGHQFLGRYNKPWEYDT